MLLRAHFVLLRQAPCVPPTHPVLCGWTRISAASQPLAVREGTFGFAGAESSYPRQAGTPSLSGFGGERAQLSPPSWSNFPGNPVLLRLWGGPERSYPHQAGETDAPEKLHDDLYVAHRKGAEGAGHWPPLSPRPRWGGAQLAPPGGGGFQDMAALPHRGPDGQRQVPWSFSQHTMCGP